LVLIPVIVLYDSFNDMIRNISSKIIRPPYGDGFLAYTILRYSHVATVGGSVSV
jgi:hypothetical protein